MDNKNIDKSSATATQKLTVNKEVCTRCGTCIAMYSEIFEFSPEGNVQVKKDASIDDKDVEEIKNVCPVGAIEDNN